MVFNLWYYLIINQENQHDYLNFNNLGSIRNLEDLFMSKYEWFVCVVICIVSVVAGIFLTVVGKDPLEVEAKEYAQQHHRP